MKKLALIVISLTLILTLAACSCEGGNNSEVESNPANSLTESGADNSKTESNSAPVPNYATVAEIIASVGFDEYYVDHDVFVCRFTIGDVAYRAEAESSGEIYEKITALDFNDPDYDAKAYAVFSPLSVTDIKNITAERLTDAELASYVGKKGKDLLDAGFGLGFGDYDGENAVYYLYYQYFQYRVTFNEKVEAGDDIDYYETMLPLTVKSVVFENYHI